MQPKPNETDSIIDAYESEGRFTRSGKQLISNALQEMGIKTPRNLEAAEEKKFDNVFGGTDEATTSELRLQLDGLKDRPFIYIDVMMKVISHAPTTPSQSDANLLDEIDAITDEMRSFREYSKSLSSKYPAKYIPSELDGTNYEIYESITRKISEISEKGLAQKTKETIERLIKDSNEQARLIALKELNLASSETIGYSTADLKIVPEVDEFTARIRWSTYLEACLKPYTSSGDASLPSDLIIKLFTDAYEKYHNQNIDISPPKSKQDLDEYLKETKREEDEKESRPVISILKSDIDLMKAVLFKNLFIREINPKSTPINDSDYGTEIADFINILMEKRQKETTTENCLHILYDYVADEDINKEYGSRAGAIDALKHFLASPTDTTVSSFAAFEVIMEYLNMSPLDLLPNLKSELSTALSKIPSTNIEEITKIYKEFTSKASSILKGIYEFSRSEFESVEEGQNTSLTPNQYRKLCKGYLEEGSFDLEQLERLLNNLEDEYKQLERTRHLFNNDPSQILTHIKFILRIEEAVKHGFFTKNR